MSSVDSNTPLDFVGRIDGTRHVVMFHEDEEYAMKIRLRFLQRGISGDQTCIYVTPSDPANVEDRMRESGIDVERAKKNGLLRIVHSGEDYTRAEDVRKREDLIDEILEGSSPKRVVLDEAPSMGEAGIRRVLDLERYAHTVMMSNHHEGPEFSDRLLLCSYSVRSIKPALHAAWMSDLLKLHDSVLFAPESSEGIGFVMR
ncbi:MAG: MEDS domain-containing protein [Thaumarchaeota archaeon]|nr:MEDS domain-containing protein [Nitrososphaerota archaeon]